MIPISCKDWVHGWTWRCRRFSDFNLLLCKPKIIKTSQTITHFLTSRII